MTKWHAHVAHMAEHMKMVGGPLWWGARGPWAPPKSGVANSCVVSNIRGGVKPRVLTATQLSEEPAHIRERSWYLQCRKQMHSERLKNWVQHMANHVSSKFYRVVVQGLQAGAELGGAMGGHCPPKFFLAPSVSPPKFFAWRHVTALKSYTDHWQLPLLQNWPLQWPPQMKMSGSAPVCKLMLSPRNARPAPHLRGRPRGLGSGSPPKKGPHHVHVFSHMYGLCVPHWFWDNEIAILRSKQAPKHIDQYSPAVTNTLFRAYCMPKYACQLWNKCTQVSMKRLRAAYNNAYRIMHYIPRHVLFARTKLAIMSRRFMPYREIIFIASCNVVHLHLTFSSDLFKCLMLFYKSSFFLN